MSTFSSTLNPTPFGFFDVDNTFQIESDAIVTFVRRKLGDDILSVELTKKQIWACFEEAFCEYGSIVNQYQAKSQLSTLLGMATGSILSGSEQRLPRENFEFMLRRGEPYAMEAGLGGSYNTLSGSIELEHNRQDYDIYSELKDADGNTLFDNPLNNPKTKMKIKEVFHFDPQGAYRFFDTTSAVNYLNNEFSFESFTPETVFYVLPVFEDVLRGGMLGMSQRVRRSNYSYKMMGTKLRIFPTPSVNSGTTKELYIRVGYNPDPMNPSFTDNTIEGVSNLSNVPFGNLIYGRINSMGRQWTRQYTLALSKELLGLIRSKFGSVPIPGAELTMNGADLVAQGREEQANLKIEIKEMLETMTYSAMLENEATAAESLTRILKMIPMPNGMAIVVG
jgi:hypothetical protein